MVHGIVHESSVSFVAVLLGLRALKKGFDTALYFFGIGALNCLETRGFPTIGDEIFPGMRNENNTLERFIGEGGTVYACRLGPRRCTARARRTSWRASSRAIRSTCRTR